MPICRSLELHYNFRVVESQYYIIPRLIYSISNANKYITTRCYENMSRYYVTLRTLKSQSKYVYNNIQIRRE